MTLIICNLNIRRAPQRGKEMFLGQRVVDRPPRLVVAVRAPSAARKILHARELELRIRIATQRVMASNLRMCAHDSGKNTGNGCRIDLSEHRHAQYTKERQREIDMRSDFDLINSQ